MDTKLFLKMKNVYCCSELWKSIYDEVISTENKYYSSASHHEQKNKKTTGQIKFLAVTVKQQIKLVSRHSLCENEYIGSSVAVAQFPLQYFLSNQITQLYIITSFNKEFKNCKCSLYSCEVLCSYKLFSIGHLSTFSF